MSYSFSMTPNSKVLLIGIDGLMLERAIKSGRASTLKSLRADSYFSEMTVDMPTVSGPSWTTLLTGFNQEVHKVIDNEYTEHNLAAAPDLLSRAKALNHSITTYAAAGWPPLIDPADVGPVIATRVVDQKLGSHRIFVRDGETNGYKTVDVEVADDAVKVIDEIGPDLSFVYFCGADEAGHLHGTLKGPYYDAIERIDTLVARMHQSVLKRHQELNENWLIVITTDHGHRDEGGHGGDSEQERASFVIAHAIGAPHPTWPAAIKPEHLVEHVLSAL
jgi:predicted AlkP superfamily pyrophosphatase or phosphodiesterase